MADTQSPPVVISPFANERARQWPARHYRELIEIILREHGHPVAIVGTRAQRASGNDLVRSFSSEVVRNTCGYMSWKELIAAVDAAPYVVSNNSGVAHLAGERSRWTLCLFAASHAFNEWMPRGPHVVTMTKVVPCSPCALGTEYCPNDIVCMTELLPIEVFWRFERARKSFLAGKHESE